MGSIREKSDLWYKVFLKLPHFFKPVQVIASSAIIISTITLNCTRDYLIWQTALASLLISATATTIFALRINNALIRRYSFDLLSWDAVEFFYSSGFVFLCGANTVNTINCAIWDHEYIVFFVILTTSYLVSVVYIVREELKILMNEQEPVIRTRTGHTNYQKIKSEKAPSNEEVINDLEIFLEH